MINNFFSVLYNRTEPTASGIYVGLTAPLVVPDAIVSAVYPLRGGTPASAETFAINALKVVDASTYRKEIIGSDSRLTYRMDEIGVSDTDSAVFLLGVTGVSGALITIIDVEYPDLRDTLRGSRVLQERAAAILVGIVRIIEAANG